MDIGAWLAETYGQDLSGVTEIKGVPIDVTGSLQPLAKCTALVKLDLGECKKIGGSLDPLAKCTKLETLNLNFCKALTGTSSVVGPENDCSCI